MRIHFLIVAALSAASLTEASLCANASERGTAVQRAACTPDVFHLCSSEIPDVDAIVSCLKREKARLSGACRTAMFGGGEKQVTAATRSLADKPDWCSFEAGASEGVEDVWRKWCK